MKSRLLKYKSLMFLTAGIIIIFLVRTLLAVHYAMPRLDEIFSILTTAGSLVVLLKGFHNLRRGDWATAVLSGAAVGAGMCFATLFTPYPFLGVVRSNQDLALVRGVFTTLAALGGLVIMRQGGPVPFHAASGNWQKTRRGVLIGLAVGLPLALLNVFALQFTQGHSITWKSPLVGCPRCLAARHCRGNDLPFCPMGVAVGRSAKSASRKSCLVGRPAVYVGAQLRAFR